MFKDIFNLKKKIVMYMYMIEMGKNFIAIEEMYVKFS